MSNTKIMRPYKFDYKIGTIWKMLLKKYVNNIGLKLKQQINRKRLMG